MGKGYPVLSHQQALRSNGLFFSFTVPTICGFGILPAARVAGRPRRGVSNKLFKKKRRVELIHSPLSLYTSNRAACDVTVKLRHGTPDDGRRLKSPRGDHLKFGPSDLKPIVCRLSADHLSKRNHHSDGLYSSLISKLRTNQSK